MKLFHLTPYVALRSGYYGFTPYGPQIACNWQQHSWPLITIQQAYPWYVWMRDSPNARGAKGLRLSECRVG